ncbi:MAG: hypothetical protein PHC64_01200 [Candidatus Gastranaerophilales bacterium]|nr:hypothetical protein [Candidatus Gastranaerophilales bacterium]
MNYDYCQNTTCQYDDFITKGVCATDPTLSALQEVILIYLQELAYYLLKLKKFGAQNEIIKENILEAISGIITNIEYNNEQFQKLIMILADDLNQAKILYANFCYKENIETAFLKPYFKSGGKLNINEIIKKGEKHFIQRNIDYTSEQKNLFDIIILFIKRLCMKIIQIKSYNKDYEKAYETILILLSTLNFSDMSINEIKSIIETCDLEYYKLVRVLYEAQEEVYGKRESVYIPFSPRNGKAVLVSGIDLKQLEAVLEATKNKGVDVYTHGMTMLMAHTLLKFREYTHLVGHFGKGSENSLFDFAAFPGAILMTSYLFQKIEYLYRGRLFTTDALAPKGIVKIKNNDFEPLIQAALQAKGFTKQQQKIIFRVGHKQKEMEEKVKDLIEKLETKEIKHLYILGILNSDSEYKEYIDKFLKILPKDCFAASLAHEQNEENILHVDSFYDYLFIYRVLEKFKEIKPLEELKISIFITKCDQYTLTNIINFINMGIKSIYLCKCIPTLINPAMVETMRKVFGIKEISAPEADIKATLAE